MAIHVEKQERPGRLTIRDVARLAGVSVATVSRVVNDRPDVAPETRNEVLRVMRTHGFTTNRSARALSGGRTGLIGGPRLWREPPRQWRGARDAGEEQERDHPDRDDRAA